MNSKTVNALKKHFSIGIKDIKQDKNDYDDEFEVMGKPVEVVSTIVAIKNEMDNMDCSLEDINKYISKTGIGIYTYLIDSCYLFRWM